MSDKIENGLGNIAQDNNQAGQFLPIVEDLHITPVGPCSGLITRIEVERGNDSEGAPYKRVRITAVSDAKDPSGQPVTADKIYNVLGKGRGISALCADCFTVSKEKISPQELNQKAKQTLLNKRVLFALKYRKEGKQQVPYIAEFLANPNDAVAQA